MDSHIDHVSHAAPGIQAFPARLYVVTAISNPARYLSRYNLYRAFQKHVADAGAILYTVELALGGRPFEITDPANPKDIQLRTDCELWHKENLLNIGISRMPPSAQYVAWIDADVVFTRPDWAQETIQQLQHHQVVQMFSESIDLGPDNQPVDAAFSWTESIAMGLPFQGQRNASGAVMVPEPRATGKLVIPGAWHSGLAWAARRSALDAVGGLIDIAILGSADRNMAAALYGFMEKTVDPSFSPGYKQALLDWQDRAVRNLRHDVGQVGGTLMHRWHGRKSNRFYTERWKILSKFQFDPRTDLKRDTQGLWVLEDRNDARSIGLRNALRQYFRMRNEDSPEM